MGYWGPWVTGAVYTGSFDVGARYGETGAYARYTSSDSGNVYVTGPCTLHTEPPPRWDHNLEINAYEIAKVSVRPSISSPDYTQSLYSYYNWTNSFDWPLISCGFSRYSARYKGSIGRVEYLGLTGSIDPTFLYSFGTFSNLAYEQSVRYPNTPTRQYSSDRILMTQVPPATTIPGAPSENCMKIRVSFNMNDAIYISVGYNEARDFTERFKVSITGYPEFDARIKLTYTDRYSVSPVKHYTLESDLGTVVEYQPGLVKYYYIFLPFPNNMNAFEYIASVHNKVEMKITPDFLSNIWFTPFNQSLSNLQQIGNAQAVVSITASLYPQYQRKYPDYRDWYGPGEPPVTERPSILHVKKPDGSFPLVGTSTLPLWLRYPDGEMRVFGGGQGNPMYLKMPDGSWVEACYREMPSP